MFCLEYLCFNLAASEDAGWRWQSRGRFLILLIVMRWWWWCWLMMMVAAACGNDQYWRWWRPFYVAELVHLRYSVRTLLVFHSFRLKLVSRPVSPPVDYESPQAGPSVLAKSQIIEVIPLPVDWSPLSHSKYYHFGSHRVFNGLQRQAMCLWSANNGQIMTKRLICCLNFMVVFGVWTNSKRHTT